MEVKNIDIKTNLEVIPNIENAWYYIYVILDNGRKYIIQVFTSQNFLECEDEKTINLISPVASLIIVKELTKKLLK